MFRNYALFLFPNRFDLNSIIKIIYKTRFKTFFEFSFYDKKDYKYDLKVRKLFFEYLSSKNYEDPLFIFLFSLYVPISKLEIQNYLKNSKIFCL